MPSPSCFETGTVKSVAWVTEISAFAYHSRAELLCMWLSTGKSNWGHWFHSTPLCRVRGWRTHSLNYSHTGTSFHPLWLHSLAIPHHSPFSHPPSPSSLFLCLFHEFSCGFSEALHPTPPAQRTALGSITRHQRCCRRTLPPQNVLHQKTRRCLLMLSGFINSPTARFSTPWRGC